jgi:hypothetical protein
MGYFEAAEARARVIEILAEFMNNDAPGDIVLNPDFSLKHAITVQDFSKD